MRLELADEVAARLGALLAPHEDALARALAVRLQDVDGALLAAEVERWRMENLAMTTDGCGAPRAALRELGLDLLGYSDQVAYNAWRKHYPPIRPLRRRP